MIDFIEGELVSRNPGQVTLQVGGIGFLISIPLSTYDRLPAAGRMGLHTHLVPREDGFFLFGFRTREEREIFLLLTTVRGVGPRLALKVLSGFPVGEIVQALQREEPGLLCKIPGIGRKTAQRLVLELKDAVKHLPVAGALPKDSAGSDAVVALIKLGAARAVAEKAVVKSRKSLPPGAGTEEIVRECLQKGLV
ncbi:MAG: Holliday junction branch migration protein RuvA [Planctomycetota bacterium]|jgi:Holliday junction DNA helicase RuvA